MHAATVHDRLQPHGRCPAQISSPILVGYPNRFLPYWTSSPIFIDYHLFLSAGWAEAKARRYCTRLSTTTRTLPWRPPESTIQFWCNVSPPHVCQLCQVCPESSLPRSLSLSLARRARNLLSLASLSLAVFWNPAYQLDPRLQVHVATVNDRLHPHERCPGFPQSRQFDFGVLITHHLSVDFLLFVNLNRQLYLVRQLGPSTFSCSST